MPSSSSPITRQKGNLMRNQIAIWALTSFILIGPIFQATATDLPSTLLQAHAHNDYEHKRPLLDALDHRFGSIEVDIWLVGDGTLLVGHDASQLRPARTLSALYLQPLLQHCRQNHGWVYKPGQTALLLIDLKTDGNEMYPVLAAELHKYRELFIPKADRKPAILAILSGSRPIELVAADKTRHCTIDGRLDELPSKATAALVPLVSDNFRNHFRWRGVGPMPPNEKAKLRSFADAAHAEGRLLRFWATPDVPAVWSELRDAGVDLIGADDLARLAEFLTSTPAAHR